jgi:tetratricopeptide (TPR) repeat protein
VAALRTLAIAIAAGAALRSAPGAAQVEATTEASRWIDEAHRHYAELDFALAIDAAQRALATPGIRDVERASALETLGCAYVVLGREANAREAFAALFRLDPYWLVREPSGSPRIQRFAEAVRASLVPDAALDPAVSLRLEMPRAARTGRAIPLEVHVEGAHPERVAIRVRSEGEIEWGRVEGRARSPQRFEIALRALDDVQEIELYAEAYDARGRVIARAGGPLVPFRLPVRAPHEDDRSGDIWLGLGIAGGALALVVVAIAVGVAAAGPERAPAGTLPPGRVELP